MTKYALVIGIAQYESPLRLLPKAAADAEAIALLLESHGYYVTRLPRKQTAPGKWMIDTTQKLTHETFSTELKTFLRDRATNQDAIIYFAGHGFRVTNPITDEAEGYLAVSNSVTNGRNAIAISDINTLISKSTLSSLVMLFDCCYAGTFIEQKSLLKSTETTILQKTITVSLLPAGISRCLEKAENMGCSQMQCCEDWLAIVPKMALSPAVTC